MSYNITQVFKINSIVDKVLSKTKEQCEEFAKEFFSNSGVINQNDAIDILYDALTDLTSISKDRSRQILLASLQKLKNIGGQIIRLGLEKDNNEGTKKQQREERSNQSIQVKQSVKQQLNMGVIKGSIPVDIYFQERNNYKVFTQGGVCYSKTLNLSNISSNSNKFYILQILQNETNPNIFIFFTRWGRVGVQGQQSHSHCQSFDIACQKFNQKLKDKLKTGYMELQTNYDEQKKEQTKKGQKVQVQSKLDKSVQDLVKLVFQQKMMSDQLKELGYDNRKMPFQKLSKSYILKGFETLKSLMDEIKGQKRQDILSRLSGEFYTLIPHDFGFQKMQVFILDTQLKINQKLQLLQSLDYAQIRNKLLSSSKIDKQMNQLDSNYLKLNTNITTLDKQSDTYKILLQYVQNTHGKTHMYKLQVQQIFQLNNPFENTRFRKDINNKQLLWHGSRLSNFASILSQGFKMPPPQAPLTSYLFGKGVNFTDVVTKSANYCFTNRNNNIGLMLLCEVALGDVSQKMNADCYANLLPPGKFSTKGVGRNAPDGGKYLQDVFVPCGKIKDSGNTTTSLLYNEFVVYDVAQIKSRFLFRMKFNYSS